MPVVVVGMEEKEEAVCVRKKQMGKQARAEMSNMFSVVPEQRGVGLFSHVAEANQPRCLSNKSKLASARQTPCAAQIP